MQIKVRVVTNAKKERIAKDGEIFPRTKQETAPLFKKDLHSGDGIYKVYVSSPPIEGRANQRVIELLADFFKVKKGQISIISGHKSKEKIIKLAD